MDQGGEAAVTARRLPCSSAAENSRYDRGGVVRAAAVERQFHERFARSFGLGALDQHVADARIGYVLRDSVRAQQQHITSLEGHDVDGGCHVLGTDRARQYVVQPRLLGLLLRHAVLGHEKIADCLIASESAKRLPTKVVATAIPHMD